MLADILFIIVGVAMILWGADRLTDGAAALARRMGMSEMVVGLTVVAFGTSMPEFVVSFMSALSGASGISVGNIVGSNLFNTLVIVGCSAIACPIAIRRSTITRDIPFVLIATAALEVLGVFPFSGSDAPDMLSRPDGAVLLLLFAFFMFITLRSAKDDQTPESPSGNTRVPLGDSGLRDDRASESSPVPSSLWKSLLWLFVGLACLIAGGEIFVRGATAVAVALGVSDTMVGLTIAAAGTSLPELATSIVAARKGHSAMAIGNVIGSNIFNILFVLGLCAAVSPLSMGGITPLDFEALLISVAMFWLFARSKHTIARWEGWILVASYILYIIIKVMECLQ